MLYNFTVSNRKLNRGIAKHTELAVPHYVIYRFIFIYLLFICGLFNYALSTCLQGQERVKKTTVRIACFRAMI
jgi:hypothetical protein